jgi:hypothetical protein
MRGGCAAVSLAADLTAGITTLAVVVVDSGRRQAICFGALMQDGALRRG